MEERDTRWNGYHKKVQLKESGLTIAVNLAQ